LSEIDAAFRPNCPKAGKLAFRLAHTLVRSWLERHGVHTERSSYGGRLAQNLKQRLSAGETLYLAGINATEHNAGVGLVEVSQRNGVRLIANEEEERYRGEKHFSGLPRRVSRSDQTPFAGYWRRSPRCRRDRGRIRLRRHAAYYRADGGRAFTSKPRLASTRRK